MRKLGFIIGVIVLLMAVMPMSDGLPAQAGEPEDDWYWKPGGWPDYALSGMPDFDQKQDLWHDGTGVQWTHCGPVAVANSLWWFDSREEPDPEPPSTPSDHYGLVTNCTLGGTLNPWDDHDPLNVIPLVDDLAGLMKTTPMSGTDVFDMQDGIREYLNQTGYKDSYYEHTEKNPNFSWIEAEVERCEDVILLLGFYWTYDPPWEPYAEWFRIGGHYVTCAGVNSNTSQLGISDPFLDNAEATGQPRVPVPHPAHPGNASVHNNATLVSHDIYDVTESPSPGGDWGLERYADGNEINISQNFQGLNGESYGPFYEPGPPIFTEIEYAVAVSPIDWYWKPGNWTDYAMSGMPDFDQKQSEWGPEPGIWSCCGPVAVANSLWYFDSREENGTTPPPEISDNYGLVTSYNASGWDDHDPQNVEPLVWDLILNYMNTDPDYGTDVYDMEEGIRDYLNDTGYKEDYYEVTVEMPEFEWIEEEVERCEDVILLLGFWWWDEYSQNWSRIGGHYVTCAGVSSNASLIGISDPFFDKHDRVPVPHPPYPHGPGVHNNTINVSHDIYKVVESDSPGGYWCLEGYADGNEWNITMNFQGQNGGMSGYPYEGGQIFTEIEYAVAVSPDTWYWKPGNWTDYAMSGMPDFDQKQDEWGDSEEHYSYCGPVSVANSLWYFDSREETGGIPPPTPSDNYGLVTNYSLKWGPNPWDDHDPSNVFYLVEDLAMLMGTDYWYGTDVYDMQQGIRDYLNLTGYDEDYYEHTEVMPEFWWIEAEVERCEDVILLLGFWQWDDWYQEWYRFGGHYVTCAGVNSNASLIGISDPFFDNAEAGGPGRVPVNHTAHPGNGAVHNNATLVSHDIYSVVESPSPGGIWGLENYTYDKEMYLYNFEGQNWGDEVPWGYYNETLEVYTEIEYAVAVSPGTTLQGHVDFKRKYAIGNATWETGLEVRFFDNATQNETAWSPINRTTDAWGNFTIEGIPPGTYDVAVKNWTSLSKMALNKTFNSTIPINWPELTESDTDNNDDIRGADFNRVLVSFWDAPGDPGWDWKYDFDRTGRIDGADFNLVLTNYNKKGDLYYYLLP